MLLVSLIGYFQQGYSEGKWWSWGYIGSLAIPIIFMVAGAWFAFVPLVLEFSETQITIATLLGKRTYDWSALDCYGPGNNVFMIQFTGDRQAYQIFSGAYPGEEWAKLTNLLETRFPDRKEAYSIGAKLFRK